jgi:arylsulfatase A-like enzyme
MKTTLLACSMALAFLAQLETSAGKPNILFISLDDQNDWIGHLGGHPLAQTPHLDALAARGTTFLNAHSQAVLCNPSRASVLSGLRPTTLGLYGLAPAPRALPDLRDHPFLPQYFAAHGYRTCAAGKIYHTGTKAGGPPDRPEFEVIGRFGGVGAAPPQKLVGVTPMGDHKLVDWGVWPPDNDDTRKGDHQVATWIAGQIRAAPAGQPFFIAAGFFLPHVPCYATQQWFDRYPDDDRVLPAILEKDREDVPRFAWYLNWQISSPRLKWVRENHQWRNLVRSYLASTSFVDAQVGRLLQTLKETGHEKDTVVVLWSDHGWHLGEKGITGKNTLWERSTRVPLVFAGPGITPGQRVTSPAELLDIFPTLIELADLPAHPHLEGHSLVPQLREAGTRREHPAITSHSQGNHAIRSERWRYIRYADGSEELYDLVTDPREWHNLAGKAEWAGVVAEHKQWLPKNERPPAPGSAVRILTYDPLTDIAIWDGQPITRDDPIPE